MKHLYALLKLALCIPLGLSSFISEAAEKNICIKNSNYSEDSLKKEVLADFTDYQKRDSSRIRQEVNFSLGEISKITYSDVNLTTNLLSKPEFSTGKIVVNDFNNIIVTCSITYTCNISFTINKNTTAQVIGDTCSPSYWEGALFNVPDELSNKTVGTFNKTFVWTKTYNLKKSFGATSKRPYIEGNVCISSTSNPIVLTIPSTFSSLESHLWRCNIDTFTMNPPSTSTSSITLQLKTPLSSFVGSDISYSGRDCEGKWEAASIKVKNSSTPQATITPSENCISTNFSGTKTASATPNYTGMTFSWSYKKDGSSTSTIIPGTGASCSLPIDNFSAYTLYVQANGGCNPSTNSIRINRKLGSNVSIQIVENNNCIEDGDIIHFKTSPSLPNIPLSWTYPKGSLVGPPFQLQPNDSKTFQIEKSTGVVGPGKTVSISSTACPSSILQGDPMISKNIEVKDKILLDASAFLQMSPFFGRYLKKVDEAPCGKIVNFQATANDMITGYVWSMRSHGSDLTYSTTTTANTFSYTTSSTSGTSYVEVSVVTCKGSYPQNGVAPVVFTISTY